MYNLTPEREKESAGCTVSKHAQRIDNCSTFYVLPAATHQIIKSVQARSWDPLVMRLSVRIFRTLGDHNSKFDILTQPNQP